MMPIWHGKKLKNFIPLPMLWWLSTKYSPPLRGNQQGLMLLFFKPRWLISLYEDFRSVSTFKTFAAPPKTPKIMKANKRETTHHSRFQNWCPLMAIFTSQFTHSTLQFPLPLIHSCPPPPLPHHLLSKNSDFSFSFPFQQRFTQRRLLNGWHIPLALSFFSKRY